MESKKSPGMPVAFLEVPPDDDSFTFPVPFCGPGHLKFNLEVNAKRCRYIFDPDKVKAMYNLCTIYLLLRGFHLE